MNQIRPIILYCFFLILIQACGDGETKEPNKAERPPGLADSSEQTLFLSDHMRDDLYFFHLSIEEKKINFQAHDTSGRPIQYELDSCQTDTQKENVELEKVFTEYCQRGIRFDDNVLVFEVPQSIDLDIRDENYGGFRITVKISNGIASQQISRTLDIGIYFVKRKIDVFDTQYLPNEVDQIPSQLKLPITQIASQRGSTGWYLGAFEGEHYMATAYHAITKNFEPFDFLYGNAVHFQYLDLYGYADEPIYLNKNLDFAIYKVKFADNERANLLLQDTPIDYEYNPKFGDPLISAGLSPMDVNLRYPGIDQNSTCQVSSDTPIIRLENSIAQGFRTGCQTWLGDSGGIIALKETGKVISVIATTMASLSDPDRMTNKSLLSEYVDKHESPGALIVPFSWIRQAILEDYQTLNIKSQRFLNYKFNLSAGDEI